MNVNTTQQKKSKIPAKTPAFKQANFYEKYIAESLVIKASASKLKKIIKENILKETGKKVKKELDTFSIKCQNHTLADFLEVPSQDIFTKAKACYEFYQDFLDKGYYSYCRVLLGPAKNRVRILDKRTNKVKKMIMMGSNNFLGLSYHPDVIKAGKKGLSEYGSGTGSYLLNGCFHIHKELEQKLADMKGTEDAMLFPSGYAANLGTISALIRRHDVAISDRLNHASIVDGCRLAEGTVEIFRHNDMEHLEMVLNGCRNRYDGKLVLADGVYSMDGDLADLPRIVKLAKEHNARLMIDDAFGTGVFGKKGHGSIDHFNLKKKVDMVMVTFTKALGCAGAALCASKEVTNYIRVFARSSFFSAAPSPSNCATVLKAIEIMETQPEWLDRLWKNREYFISNLLDMGFNLGETASPILPIIVGDEHKLREMSKDLDNAGLFICPIPYPAVAKDNVRFRLCVMATHTKKDLNEALSILQKVGKKFDLI